MNNMLEKLKQYLASKTKEELAEEWENITHEKFYSRWVEKLHSLSVGDRNTFIEKVVKKYNSMEYFNREYRMGYEPRCPLYILLQKYAERYGEPLPATYSTYFVESARSIDSKWAVRLFVGQGSFIKVERIV